MDTAELKEKVARKLKANPRLKTAMLADALGVAEAEIMRAMPVGYATELDSDRAEDIIRELDSWGTLYIVVRNTIAVMEVKGAFGGFSQSGPYFNVAGENLHMHLKLGEVENIFAVKPPTADDSTPPLLSLQFFDGNGASGLKAFILPSLIKPDGPSLEERHEQWEQLRKRYSLTRT